MLKVAEKTTKGKIDPSPFMLVSTDRKSAIWLENEIAKAQSGVTSQVVDLTPELARLFLGRNPGNRSISESIVASYVRDMDNDAWRFNGEPIILSREGTLNDGQHRCMAVVLSGKTIPAVLIIGVERDTRLTLDQGKMRTAGDYLAMEGHVDTNTLAAAGRMVWQWRKFGFVSETKNYRPTKSEVLQVVNNTPALTRAVSDVGWTNLAAAGSRSMMAFCSYAFGLTASKDEVSVFIHGIATGENLPGQSPILYARNRLLAERGRLKVGERAELLFRSWNAYRRGEQPKAIALQGGELPMVES